jgi:predicted ABC-type ATPase
LSRPALTFVGGANGSGKTTLTRWNSELFREIPVLDPDTIGQTLQSTASAIFSIAGARQVLRSAKEHLRKSESFAVETTLAGKNYLRMMLEARREGLRSCWSTSAQSCVEINLARIRNRVLAGSHDVPEADVRRRYKRSFKNLPIAIKRADHTILFDNSTEEGYRLIDILGSTESQWLKEPPNWASVLKPNLTVSPPTAKQERINIRELLDLLGDWLPPRHGPPSSQSAMRSDGSRLEAEYRILWLFTERVRPSDPTSQMKRRPWAALLALSGKLKPVQESSIHAHVVLVGNARKTEHHPIELDCAENQLVFSEVCAAAEHHRHAAVADATARSMGAAKQSMRIRGEASLVGRDYRTKCVSVEIRARVIYAAEIPGRAHPASEVQVGGSVPAAGMPSAVGAGELVASVNFWLRRFLSHSQTRNHAK